ncbi:GNAT family N-acetyltransferase [Kurthia sibirica]|uniref:N-acetyltransferase n=1 Tax=Kurthia sibirica TaxID=202750 RepID=A0A2U3AKA7_9BACL|nr:GNAT family N-acetyltransferase [Kurthia sibirica]PWI24934.1 N-acetyltransferase [Kurthia sibirica]GEK33155.1 hypothetical protein KSI01_06880 [Kurthia sibirica]
MNINIEKKYIPLANYFNATTEAAFKLSFTEIETIIGQKLPNAAYLNQSWWKKTKPPLQHYLAWTSNGYIVSKVQPGYFIHFEKPQHTITDKLYHTEDKQCTFIIRPAELDDARNILNLQDQFSLDNSIFFCDHMTIPHTTQSLRKKISQWHSSKSGHLLTAIVDGSIGGIIQVVGNASPAMAHRAEINIGILPQYETQHIDLALLETAEQWARQNGINRLELSVLKAQNRTIKRFEKFGFSIEGIRQNALFIDGRYEDEFYMGKVLL